MKNKPNEGRNKKISWWQDEKETIKIEVSSCFRTLFLVVGGVLLGVVLLGIFNSEIMRILINIFERNIGSLETSLLIGYLHEGWWLLIFAVLSIFLLGLFIKGKLELVKGNFFWTFLTLLFVILGLVFGLILIDNLSKAKHIELNLQNVQTRTYGGNVSCWRMQDGGKLIYAGDPFECAFYEITHLKDKFLLVDMRLENGTIITKANQDGSSSISNIIAPKDMEYISFTIRGKRVDYPNTRLSFSTGYPRTFLTREEYEENRRLFTSYVIGLIGILLFAVPTFIINLRNIMKKKNI